MQYALVNGQRQEAQPGLSGNCPGCSSDMVSKCGEQKIWHWAHRGQRNCDTWWENETEWHRAWKRLFPMDWHECVHHAESGEKHIADVKTPQGWVLEFQHSFLNPEERRSRDSFYPKLVWVVDATRRKRDLEQFNKALNGRTSILPKVFITPAFPNESALVREWEASPGSVFFDFGEVHIIWWLLPKTCDGLRYIFRYSRKEFVQLHSSGQDESAQNFEKFLKEWDEIVRARMRPQPRAHAFQPRMNRYQNARRHSRF